MTLNQLTALIVGWAHDRNLIEGSNYRAQCIKLGEELGEIAEAAEANDEAGVADGIGDCYVVATIMAVQLGSSITLARENNAVRSGSAIGSFGRVCASVARGNAASALEFLAIFINTLELESTEEDDFPGLTECVAAAWEQIKDRKGRMVDGVLIKDGE